MCVCIHLNSNLRAPDGSLIVQYIPDWFPGTGFKALAKEARNKFNISVKGPLEYVKNAMKVRL